MKTTLITLLLLTLFTSQAHAGKIYKNFDNKSELSIVNRGGNSQVETYNAKTENTYTGEQRTYFLGGHYTLGLQGNEDGDLVESARNWDVRGQADQKISGKLSALVAAQIEGDEFAGFSQRDNYDIGLKYSFVNTDDYRWFLEAAYRYTQEQRTAGSTDGSEILYFNKASITTEFRKKPNKKDNYTYAFWLQYLPNFTESDDYQINFEPSFSVMINEIFSMKLAYRANYYNLPRVENGAYLDYQYTTSLVAEF